MKILIRLSLLVFVPIIVGLALMFSGYDSIGSKILAFGTPAVMGALVIVGLIMMMKGKLFEKPSDESKPVATEQSENAQENHSISNDGDAQDVDSASLAQSENEKEQPVDEVKESQESASNGKLSQKEKERAAIDAVNNSTFYESKFKLAEYEADHIAEATKHASKKGCAIGIIIVVLIVADVILATVFTIKQIWVGAIVCVSIFGVTIITGIITLATRQAISMRSDIRKAEKFVRGNVKSCVLSSMVQHKRVSNPAVKISDIVYRVILCADGVEYVAYSRQFYETDETVVFAVMGKKRAKIVEESDLAELNDEMKNKYNDCLNSGEAVLIKQAFSRTSAGRTHNYSHRRRH